MKHNFYCEYPGKKSFSKLKIINFNTSIYLASESLEDFKNNKNEAKKYDINNSITEFIYWPILKQSEGYWMSPFSSEKGLERILTEIEECDENLKIKIDAEIPIYDLKQIITGFKGFKRKKELLKKFIKESGENGNTIITAEIPPINKYSNKIIEKLGISYDSKKYGNKQTFMCYSSIGKYLNGKGEKILSKKLEDFWQDLPDGAIIGLGCMGSGQLKNEPQISYRRLEEELNILKKYDVSEVILYRLGGLNNNYLNIITKTIKN